MKDEQAFLREQFKEESILWWGKPSMKHTLRVEKRIIFTCISGIVITTIGLILPPYGIKGFLISISLCSPMYIFILYQLVRWPIRKKNTYFVLTDKRAAVLYRKNRKWNEITKTYESMFHCDVQQKKSVVTLSWVTIDMGLIHHTITKQENLSALNTTLIQKCLMSITKISFMMRNISVSLTLLTAPCLSGL